MNPIVSVIIPCRDEERYIAQCLDSVIVQNYPKDRFELIVVDGMSLDRTREILQQYAKRYPFITILENHEKIVPAALNMGIMKARGDIIIRMDAHTKYDNDYIAKCVRYLQQYKADNVGGIWVTLPGSDTVVAKSIALALSHPFGVGNAYFRIGSKEPKEVDTVPFGCYRKNVFERIGLFDTDLVRNQDDEFNLRLIKNGGRILLVPDIVSYYYARDSLSKLWNMYYQYGYFKPLVSRKVGAVLTVRQIVPALFTGILIASAISSFLSKEIFFFFLAVMSLYLFANLGFSLSIAVKKGMKHFPVLPAIFAVLHFSYGFGYLYGIWDFLVLKKQRKDIPLTR